MSLADTVHIGVFWLFIDCTLCYSSDTLQGFSALSVLRSSFSRYWHNIWRIFSIFWSCSSLPVLVKTSILVFRVSWLILWILLNKNISKPCNFNTEVWYSPPYLMEYKVFLYHCSNSELFWTVFVCTASSKSNPELVFSVIRILGIINIHERIFNLY